MPTTNSSSESPSASPAVRSRDPFRVLGLPMDATTEQVRGRYLDLVRLHPPERDPDRFREIHDAYRAASDPLVQAAMLITPPPEPPPWNELLDEARRNPPRLPVELLLSLGNRPHEQTGNASDE